MNETKTSFSFRVEDFKGVGHYDDECPICKCKNVTIRIRADTYGAIFDFECGHSFLYESGSIWFKSWLNDESEIE